MQKGKLFLLIISILFTKLSIAQTSYIQVVGEPDLSVFLNNSFKAKTTAELGGCIIEQVTPGKNLIKIVKDGFTPFEETITVKPGEVLAYKVKPFTKHKVYVSQEGNTNETDKKLTVKTGKLIVQSVPIEIKITISDIDGIKNSPKTKDKWLADEIPEGAYKITFTYNQKIITKTIEILSSETTSLFINMLNGDFKSSNTVEEEIKKIKEGEVKFMNYIHSNYKIGLSVEETKKAYPELALKYDTNKIPLGGIEELVSSKKNIKFYVKNNIVIGCQAEITSNMNRKNDFRIYKETFEVGNKIKEELIRTFWFYPKTEQTVNEYFYYWYKAKRIKYSDIPLDIVFDPHDFKVEDGDKVSYIWNKNEKTVQLDIIFNKVDKLLTLIMGYDIYITIIDKNLSK